LIYNFISFHYSKALSTLSRTQSEAEAIEVTLKQVKVQQKETSKEMLELFTLLTVKTNQLERIKANLGHQSSVLSAMRVMCVSICVCLSVCLYVCACVCVHASTYVHTLSQ